MKRMRAAFDLLSLRFMLQQIALGFGAFVLFVAWLRVSDGTVLAVAASALLALIILGITFGGEAWLLLRLRGSVISTRGLVRGAIALGIAVALLYPLSALISHASTGDALSAGYFNSRFPASMRNTFSYAHWMTFFEQAWDSLFWACVVVFTMAAVASTAAHKPLAAFARMLRSYTAWVVLSLATIVGSEATSRLLYWTPGHGLAIEASSVVLRVIAITLLDGFLVCLSLALLVVLCKEVDEDYLPATADGGTPDFSQPRTAESP